MSEPLTDGEPPAGLLLTTAEWGLWQAFRNGSTHDLRTGDPAGDDPNGELLWDARRTVRARVIALLLLHGPPPLLGRVASLQLAGALITGRLDLSGGRVQTYVELTQCRFENEVALTECRMGTVRLVDCHVPRLEAARAVTDGDLHLARCTLPEGIRLTDATIGTDLMLNQATIGSGTRSRAVAADGLAVGQDLQAGLLVCNGEVSLRGARIGGSLFMYGSVLRNQRGRYALHAPEMHVARFAHFACSGPATAHLTQGATPPAGTGYPVDGYRVQAGPAAAGFHVKQFQCTGGMKLDDGRFGDSLVLDRVRFTLHRGQEVSLRRVQTPELCFTPERPENGWVVLSGATVGNLVDSVDSWPVRDGLWMAGFTYEHLIPVGPFPLERRLEWVAAATPEYSPEPYEQLATVLRNGGEDADARLVLLAKQRRRRETLSLVGKVWGFLQDWTVAYGYRPGLAALWMALLWLAGTLFFAGRRPEPLDADKTPHWNAAVYALDLLLPVIDLGHGTAWNPVGAGQWTAVGLILAGWVLATTVAAGATRLLRRH
ncbi:oxidoreductase [Streptomyces sp. TRM 70351]|uniref:oxidoreductase n=1 Tax=Streptomyces sp. TRM 70351 TaxID=3116552 RepID=UPI002E7C4F10|nr:oxidoreductase [Streptomyces sp. TRM 70351]MEE1930461.1 oxidoreductase [Streptomyces sp. TRM 70351]